MQTDRYVSDSNNMIIRRSILQGGH